MPGCDPHASPSWGSFSSRLRLLSDGITCRLTDEFGELLMFSGWASWPAGAVRVFSSQDGALHPRAGVLHFDHVQWVQLFVRLFVVVSFFFYESGF